MPSLTLTRMSLVALTCLAPLAGAADIHAAAKKGDLARMQILVKQNPASVSIKNAYGEMPLFAAIEGGHRDAVAFLLANGADVNARNKTGDTPLHRAAACADRTIVELLVSYRADLDARNDQGYTPVDIGVKFGSPEVRAFLESQAVLQAHPRPRPRGGCL